MLLGLDRDLRHAWRSLLKEPLFTLAVVLPLALGLGANVAIFSVADALLRQPVPLPDIQRLVLVTETAPDRPQADAQVAPANYLAWRENARSYEALAAYASEAGGLSGAGDPEVISVAAVTPNFFPVLGVAPLHGRWLSAGEGHAEHEQGIVLRYDFWKRRFAGDAGILGHDLTIDSTRYTVVGIMPRGCCFPVAVDVWKRLALEPRERADRRLRRLNVVGRLEAGVSSDQAQAEITGIAARLAGAYPDTNRGWGARVMPLADFLSGGLTQRYTLLMMGVVAFVLLIVCSNVAGLQLARAAARRREVAVRYALGAARWQVVRLLLLESLGLALVSAALALPLAQLSIHLIKANMPPAIEPFVPGFDQIGLDRRALLFTLALAALSGIVSGLSPALSASRAGLVDDLKDGGRGATSGPSQRRSGRILMIGEVATTLVLLVGMGLMVRGTQAIRGMTASLEPQHSLTARVHLAPARYPTTRDRSMFYQRVLEQMLAAPGVSAAVVATAVPYGGHDRWAPLELEGQAPAPGEGRVAMVQMVTPDFFRMMGISARQGRTFESQDGAEAPAVAVVSRHLARRYWPAEEPIGRQLRVGAPGSESQWLRVVGVVDDLRYSWLDSDPSPVVYQPLAQAGPRDAFLLLRSQGDPTRLTAALVSGVAAVDPEQPLSSVQTWDRLISQSIVGLSYVGTMMSVLGLLAVLLTSIGIYGLISYSVEQRVNEIGIRTALGAQPRDIRRMVVRAGLSIAWAGLGLGLLLAFLLAQRLSSLVFGVGAADPWTFGGATGVLLFVVLLASYIPAYRAARIDPLQALRSE